MSHMNPYLLQRLAQQRHQELLDEAERERLARQATSASQRDQRNQAAGPRPLRRLAYLALVAILTLFVAAQVVDASAALPSIGPVAYLVF